MPWYEGVVRLEIGPSVSGAFLIGDLDLERISMITAGRGGAASGFAARARCFGAAAAFCAGIAFEGTVIGFMVKYNNYCWDQRTDPFESWKTINRIAKKCSTR